jgi:branched-chain amino acid transport system substrate-binding protein
MKLRRTAWLSAVAAVGILAAACGGGNSSGGGSKSPYTFGYDGDQTGGASSTGVPLYNGFKTYIDTINSKGGVNGHKIQVDARDDHSDPSTARINLQSFASEGAIGDIGSNSSSVSGAIGPLAAQQKMLQIGIAPPDSLVIPAQPYIYSTQVGSSDMGFTMIDFVQNVLIKNGTVPASPKVGVMSNNTATSAIIAKLFDSEFQRLGWKKVVSVTIDNTATDATSQDSQIASANPDVMLAMILDNTAPFVLRGLQTRSWNKPFVAYVGASSESTFGAIANENYYGMRSYAYPKDPSIPAAVEMVKEANKLGYTTGLESTFFTSGYVLGMVVADAIAKCSDPCTGEKLNTAMDKLGDVDAKNLAGTLHFDSTHHRSINKVRFFHWSQSAGHSAAAGDFVISRAPTT